MASVKTAPIKWAQRTDSLYVTIAVPGMCTCVVFVSTVGVVLCIVLLLLLLSHTTHTSEVQ